MYVIFIITLYMSIRHVLPGKVPSVKAEPVKLFQTFVIVVI